MATAPISLSPVKEQARTDLLSLLGSIAGRKTLYLERSFALPLSFVADAALLREHGVDAFGVLDGDNQALDGNAQHAVYVVHASPESLSAAIKSVQALRSVNPDVGVTWAVVPTCTLLAARLLEAEGMGESVSLRPLPIHWIVVDDDVLSMELNGAYASLALTADPTPTWSVALALTSLQQQIGIIPHISGIGPAALRVREALAAQREDSAPFPEAAEGAGIDRMVILDRCVDMVTPLCTQFTYEGLLDEIFGLRCGQANVEVEGTRKVRGLNSSDAVWRETRGLSYLAARRWLHETLRSFQTFRDEGMATADVRALKGFVAELKEKFSRLPLHVSIVDALGSAFADPSFAARQAAEASLLADEDDGEAIEELLYGEAPLEVVLRLLALRSIVLNGVPRKSLDAVRRDVLNTYGFQHVATLDNMNRAGLLAPRVSRRGGAFPALKDAFKLLLPPGDGPDEAKEPDDVHYAYAGYAPLSVRLVELAVTGSWSAAPGGQASLPGPAFELQQTTDDDGFPIEVEGTLASHDARGTSRRPVTLVVFVGGATAAELAALRFLAAKNLVPCDFAFAVTSIVTGSSLMGELCAPGAPPITLLD